MQTMSFTRHFEQIVRDLRAQQIVDFLTPFLDYTKNTGIQDETKNQFSSLIFASKEGFFSLSQNLDQRRILESMGFAQIFEPTQLGKMVTAFNTSQNTAGIYGAASSFPLFANFFHSLSTIIRFQKMTSQLLYTEKVGSIPTNEAILEVEIVDYDSTGIEITRVQATLNSLTVLHEHLARLLGEKDARLRLSFIDSGSDFVLALQSTKAIIDIARLLFEQYWQKIRFKTYDDFDRKVDSLSKGLRFVELVHEQVNKKVIDEETGRILKYSVLDEMTNLTAVGATLRDVELQETVDRRRLLQEKKGIKLLGPASNSSK